MINFKKKSTEADPSLIPTRFKQFVDKKKRRLVELSPASKSVAALNKILSKQSVQEGVAYFVAGDYIWLASMNVTRGTKDGQASNSYTAKGRSKLGRKTKDGTSFEMAEFELRFRDSTDEMGLPDLSIDEASVQLLDRTAPLDPNEPH